MKSERFKTELITNVSHDIKTPLTSIINYVDLMKKRGDWESDGAAIYRSPGSSVCKAEKLIEI